MKNPQCHIHCNNNYKIQICLGCYSSLHKKIDRMVEFIEKILLFPRMNWDYEAKELLEEIGEL